MNKTQIKAEIVADSLSPQGERLTSLLITTPRIILSEINTHRMLSKNTSSSRAIPFKKMVESVENDPFTPIAWQSHHSGMQGSEYLDGESEQKLLVNKWLEARDLAVQQSKLLNNSNVTKQLCNRLLEPFMWTTMLITGSKEGWDNFFKLRCPQYKIEGKLFKSKKEALYYKDSIDKTNKFTRPTDLEWMQINEGQAEIHIMDLSEKIYNAIQESTPKQLEGNQWHVPFGNKINELYPYLTLEDKIKVSVGMAANTSYTVVGDGSIITLEKATRIHDKCKDLNHSSVFEHCAKAMDDSEYQTYIKGKLTELNPDRDFNENIEIEEPLHTEKGWCRNYKGFLSYRHLIETKK